MSLVVTVCHHSASLVMPNSDPRYRFFDLTLMMNPYSLTAENPVTFKQHSNTARL